MHKNIRANACMLIAFVLLTPLAAHACPGCASTFSKSLASAFNASVLFMMAMPFTLFGAFIFGFIMLNRAMRKRMPRAMPASSSASQTRIDQRID